MWVPRPVVARIIDHQSLGLDSPELLAEIIGFSQSPAQPYAGAAPAWLPPPIEWGTLTPEQVLAAPPTAPVSWMLFLRLPPRLDEPSLRSPVDRRERAVTVQIDDERFPVRLAPEPADLPVARIPPIEASAEAWRRLGDQLALEALDPTRRWRVELLTERFGAQRLFAADSLAEHAPLADPVLRGVARSFEYEWRSAISSLDQQAPDLAAALLARLTAVTKLPHGSLLPAWPTDGAAEAVVLPALLSRSLTAHQRVDAVEAFLQTQPTTRITVLDDAGEALRRADTPRFHDDDSTAETRLTASGTTILVTDLTTQPGTLTLGPLGEFDPELIRLDAAESHLYHPDVSTIHQADGSAPAGAAGGPTGMLGARRNEREIRAQFRVAPLRVTRPGLLLGPALEVTGLGDWNAGAGASARRVPPDWQSAVMVFRDDQTGVWKLYIEARFPGADRPDAREEAIQIYLGPYRQPDAVLSLSATDEQAVVTEDRWSAILAIPSSALERAQREGTLAIGFVRQDGRTAPLGEPGRSSWPRPLFPGQPEPGRFRLDLSAWLDAPGQSSEDSSSSGT